MYPAEGGIFSSEKMYPAEASKISLKLVVDKGVGKVLYAEAGKDFVAFLSCWGELPYGAVLNLSTESKGSAALFNLSRSIERITGSFGDVRLLLSAYMAAAAAQEGCVTMEQPAKFLVMDDLMLKPMPPISVAFLTGLGVKDLSLIEERPVCFTVADQGMKMLEASLHSKTVLSDVFLGK